MKLWCNSFQGFKKVLETNNWTDSNLPNNVAFISICCTLQSDSYFLPNDFAYETHLLSDNHDNVINLDFDDINGYTLADQFPDDECIKNSIHKYAKGINDEQGLQLVKFIENNVGKDIYVHCSAGISRSQAIVKFILEFYNEYYTDSDTNPDNPCEYPNIHVYEVLRKAYAINHYHVGYKWKTHAVKNISHNGKIIYEEFGIIPGHAMSYGYTEEEIVNVECEIISFMWDIKDQLNDNSLIDYQGFIDFYDMEPTMIYPHAKLFNCCFPYGWINEVKHNKGLAIRLKVKELI